MKKPISFPLVITENGVSAKIRRVTQKKGQTEYVQYVVDYSLFGKRKQEWRADLDQAKDVARRACIEISNGQHLALELRNEDRVAYLRASEALAPLGVPIDAACRDYGDAMLALAGTGSLIEAVRFFVKAHNVEVPRVPVSSAVDEMIVQARRDGKSQDRLHQLETYLNRFKDSFNCNVTDLSSKLVSDFIIAMPVKNLSNQLTDLSKTAKVEWRRNALRHSYFLTAWRNARTCLVWPMRAAIPSLSSVRTTCGG